MSDDVNQFGLPRGVVGRGAGWVMALANADMERRSIELLDPLENHHVGAIGFGPGVGVRTLARRVVDGRVSGVDPSLVMCRQATRRNRGAIARGQVDLRQGAAEALPWPDDVFDGVISVNNVMLWDPLDQGLRELMRVLTSGGRAVMAVHRWVLDDPDSFVPTLIQALETADFVNVHTEEERARSGRAIYVAAHS